MIVITDESGFQHSPERVRQMTNREIERLIDGVRRGDGNASETLYREFSGSIYFFVLRIVGNETAAEDIMQDTFIAILQKSDRYTPRGKPAAWIFSIAKNKAIDHLRGQGRYVPLEEEILPSSDARELSDDAWPELLRTLNEKERDIVILRVLDGYTLTEIARNPGMPKGTVFWTYNNAMKKLRKEFGKGEK